MQFEAQGKANGHSAVSHAATARADEASMGKHTPLVKVSSEVRMLWRPFSHWCGGQMPRKSKGSGFAGSVRLPKGCKRPLPAIIDNGRHLGRLTNQRCSQVEL